jgi:hypothetical protein
MRRALQTSTTITPTVSHVQRRHTEPSIVTQLLG